MKIVNLFFLVCFFYSLTLVPIAYGKDLTRFRGVMISPDVNASDLQYLGQTWNVNIIRWQLRWKSATDIRTATPEQYHAWLESSLQKLDNLLPVCDKYGIRVLIDLHSTPGGFNSSDDMLILKDTKYQTQFLNTWTNIASRYANNKVVWGYDLANEPNGYNLPAGVMSWSQLATAAAQNIRKVDTVHTIVVEPRGYGAPAGFKFKDFVPLPSSISNVVYSVHMYLPWNFASQGVGGNKNILKYPGIIDKVMFDKEQLRRELQPVVDFQSKYGVRIFVGEFSAVRWAPEGSAYNYLKDVIDIFESNGWDWTYHAFREWQGWSVEHSEDKNEVNPTTKQTNREKLLRSWFSKNQHY